MHEIRSAARRNPRSRPHRTGLQGLPRRAPATADTKGPRWQANPSFGDSERSVMPTVNCAARGARRTPCTSPITIRSGGCRLHDERAPLRDAVSGRGSGWLELAHHPAQARELPQGVRRFFDAEKMVRYGRRQTPAPECRIPASSENRLKVEAFVSNAKALPRDPAPPWAHSTTTSGIFTGGKVFAPPAPVFERCCPVDRTQRRDEQGSQTARFSVSSAPPSARRSCRPWASSMNISVYCWAAGKAP